VKVQSFFVWVGELLRLRRQQWLRPEELKALQQNKLRKLIKHAYEQVPYYHQLFDSNRIKPEDIRTVRDLVHLPITTKALFQSLPLAEVTARNVDLNRCICSRTSGTLGIPLTLYYRKEDHDILDFVWARAKGANGQRLVDRVVSIKESTYSPSPRSWYEHLGIWKKTFVSDSLGVEEQLDLIEGAKAQVLSGYPSSLKLLAHGLEGQRHRRIKPRLIFTMAELLDPPSRRVIASAFGAQLFDFYGSHELGLVAWECSKRAGYHINSDSVVVEFIWNGRPVSPGQEGNLVCTALHSYAMPFIRYEIGDVGMEGDQPCPCGRGLPLMRMIEGRFNDFIVLKDGRRISPFQLTCAIENVPGIAKYQIVQEKVGRMVVRLVRGREFSQGAFGEIRQRLYPLVGEGMEIDFQVLEDVQKETRKYQVVLSKVSGG